MALNEFVEKIVIDNVKKYVKFYNYTYRWNLHPWIAFTEKTGIKNLKDYGYADCYASKMILATRAFQNFDYFSLGSKSEEIFTKIVFTLEEYAQELINDIVENICVKPQLIITNFNICPKSGSLHIHSLFVFPSKVRKAELIKIGPSLGYSIYNFSNDESLIFDAIKHAEPNGHEPTLITRVYELDKNNNYKTTFVENNFDVFEYIDKVKKIVY